MGIEVFDLKRALSAGGEISALAPICQQALGKPPLVPSQLADLELSLPDPGFLSFSATSVESKNTSALSVDLSQALKQVDVELLPLPYFGKNVGRLLTGMIDEIQPDMIAVDACPVELGAHVLYAFSLPAALGMPVMAQVRQSNSDETYFNRTFYPGNRFETAVVKSWLSKIPLMPVSQPLKARRMAFIAEQGWLDLDALDNAQWEEGLRNAYEALDQRLEGVKSVQEGCRLAQEYSLDLVKGPGSQMREKLIRRALYIGSRILDQACDISVAGRRSKILAVVDMGVYADLHYVLDLLRRGILEETYTPASRERYPSTMILQSRLSTELEAESRERSPESTLSQELFQKELAAFSEAYESEEITRSEAHRLIVSIAGRTRNHPAVQRGVSVRGAIAFEEISRGLAELTGGVNRAAITRAALIALPPRVALKQPGDVTEVIRDIVKEELYGIRFEGRPGDFPASLNSKKLTASDIMDQLNPLLQTPADNAPADQKPAVVSETAENQRALKNLEALKMLRKDQQGQYQLTKKALEFLLDDLEQKLKDGEISQEDYNQQKKALLKKMDILTNPRYQMSSKELANTVMEMMDAQDKLWEKEVNFSTLHVYYHVKENSNGGSLMPQKRDYQALKRLIDDMDKRKILAAVESSSGYVLTGLALSLLLKYLVDKNDYGTSLKSLAGAVKTQSTERKNEVRRYTTGDAFRDISVRHTLNEIVRQKKSLSEVRSSDFRVYLKLPQRPQQDIVICLDTSGSMGFHQKMIYARLAAAGLAQAAFDEGDRVGLVAFNDWGQVTVPLSDNNKEELLNCIAAATPRGNTNIGDGIKSSVDLLFQSPSHNQKYILLVTDGQPTALSESAFAHLKESKQRDLTEESALLETRRAAARGVKLSVIHVAAEGEPSGSFIKDIARSGKGKIRRVSSAPDLKAVMR